MKQDLQLVAVDVRAIDVGYYNTKYSLGRERSGDSNVIKSATFPSLAPRVPMTQMTSATGLQGANAWLIAVNGVDYIVGPGAASQATGSEPRPVDDDYSATDKYYALMLGALNHMAETDRAGQDYLVRCLVLGLPLSTYAKHAAKLKAKMIGEHQIGRAAGPGVRKVIVEDVKVMVQPHGALVHRGAGNPHALNGLNLVVDPGGGTLDWFVAKGTEPNWARSGAYPKAMLHCALAVAESINKAWRNQFDIMEAIDEALRTSADTFMVGPREYSVESYRPAVDAVLEEAVKTMLEKTGSLDNARQIIFVGGGAPLFHEYMGRKFPELKPAMVVETNPVFTNLYGFQIAGELQLRRART